jgi:hypothetical protein
MFTVMGSLNSDCNTPVDWLIIAWIAAEFGSPVIEVSNVALIVSPAWM